MDYAKSGYPKASKGSPRHHEHNAKGSQSNPFGGASSKAELLARMKAAAEAASAAAAEAAKSAPPKAEAPKKR